MLDVKRLGKRIAFLRRQTAMTQEKLAALLFISPQAVSKWENGHSMPETSLLPALAQVFRCSIDEIVMPAYQLSLDVEERKQNKLVMQVEYTANDILQQWGSIMPEGSGGLNDTAIIEAVRKVYPNVGNYEIKRGKPETHDRYDRLYITVATPQREIRLVEKVYRNEDRELFGYELLSRYVVAVPQVYYLDTDKKILLMEDLNDYTQGFHFDEIAQVERSLGKIMAPFCRKSQKSMLLSGKMKQFLRKWDLTGDMRR